MKYIIYKIQIKDYIYIGSTQNFTQRKAKHKKNCNCDYEQRHNCVVYKIIRENGGWDCCTMIPIKEIEVESKIQAHIEEEAIRIEYNAQMNTRRAYKTEEQKKEYRKEYQNQRKQTPEYKEYQKQYRLAKKVKLAESPENKV